MAATLLGSYAGCTTALRPPVEISVGEVVALPNLEDSVKFAVLGDFGTGSARQYALAAQMAKARARFPFEFVITVGDNLYGSQGQRDFERKFEIPYKPLLDAGVLFYAALGNHDRREQRAYKQFNMDGRLYYSFRPRRQSVRFFALESTYMTPEQVAWFEKELSSADETWKIPYFHHPLYSSGARHGSNLALRKTLEPMLLKAGVSVVFAGHDHFYERMQPQQGIVHFVVGSGGQLRVGNIRPTSGLTAKGFDRDLSFLMCEINRDRLYFQAVSRAGQVIDSGVIERRATP